MEASKIASKQDCNYAINPGNSNETSVKLTGDMVELLGVPDPDDKEYKVTLRIFREDLFKMLAYIVSNLPLLDKKGNLLYFSEKFYEKKLSEIKSFFRNDNEVDYPVTLLNNSKRIACIQGFPSGLNIRDFMVEDATVISICQTSTAIEFHLAPRYRALDKKLLNTGKIEKSSSTKLGVGLPIQMITYGAPGTGKSYATSKATKKYPREQTIRTTFHPDSDYSTFVGAYKPTKGEDGNITYEFTPQPFMQAYTKAWKNPNAPVFLIIEEINRGNCAQIFGDIFQLLDRNSEGMSSYDITPDKDIQDYIAKQNLLVEKVVINDDGEDISDKIKSGELMSLPANLYIWATMNTSDQSLFPIDSAFKRRWEWDYVPIENQPGKNWKIRTKNGLYDWWSFLQAINEKIAAATQSEDKKLGYFFAKADEKDEISVKTFVGKVIFYLWNDVFKDTEFSDDIFKSYETTDTGHKTISFSSFFLSKGVIDEKMVDHFLANLDIENELKQVEPTESVNIEVSQESSETRENSI